MQLLAKDHRLTHMFAVRAERRVFGYGVTTLALLSATVLLRRCRQPEVVAGFRDRRAHRISQSVNRPGNCHARGGL